MENENKGINTEYINSVVADMIKESMPSSSLITSNFNGIFNVGVEDSFSILGVNLESIIKSHELPYGVIKIFEKPVNLGFSIESVTPLDMSKYGIIEIFENMEKQAYDYAKRIYNILNKRENEFKEIIGNERYIKLKEYLEGEIDKYERYYIKEETNEKEIIASTWYLMGDFYFGVLKTLESAEVYNERKSKVKDENLYKVAHLRELLWGDDGIGVTDKSEHFEEMIQVNSENFKFTVEDKQDMITDGITVGVVFTSFFIDGGASASVVVIDGIIEFGEEDGDECEDELDKVGGYYLVKMFKKTRINVKYTKNFVKGIRKTEKEYKDLKGKIEDDEVEDIMVLMNISRELSLDNSKYIR